MVRFPEVWRRAGAPTDHPPWSLDELYLTTDFHPHADFFEVFPLALLFHPTFFGGDGSASYADCQNASDNCKE
jgi:hypothetical protein